MLLRTDGKARGLWALRDPVSGLINLAYLCDSESAAQKLRRAHLTHKRHEEALEVVAVQLTLAEDAP